jgi:hypothetical protein
MDQAAIIKVLLDSFRRDSRVDKRVRVLMVNNDNSRSVLFRGRYYAPLVDTIADDLACRGVDSMSVARIASNIRGERSHARVHAPDGAFSRALIHKQILRVLSRRHSPYSSMEEGVWRRIIRDSGARKIVAIQPSRELCLACHEANVWVADLQHGVIARGHPWYDENSRGHEPSEWLPSEFLLWDDSSARVIGDWVARRGKKTRVIGHPWLNRFRTQSPEDAIVQEQKSKFSGLLPARGGKANILVSLSWGEADLPNGFLHAELEALIRQTSRRFNWMIRLHPNQVRGFARGECASFESYRASHLPEAVEWRHSTDAPLPVVLGVADLHLTWTSSVTIEAGLMGVPTGLLNPKLLPGGQFEHYFAGERATGMVAIIPPRTESILIWIEASLGQRGSLAVVEAAERSYRDLIDFLAHDV